MAFTGESMTNSLSKSTTETFVIGEGEKARKFISNGWSPLKAAKNLPPIGKAFATPISFLFGANEDTLQQAIPQALYMLFEQMEESDVEQLFSMILQDVYVNPQDKVDLNRDFYNIDEMLTLMALVLKQHYGCLIEGKGFTNLFRILVPMGQLSATN